MLKKLADFMDCIWKILVQVIPRYNDSISWYKSCLSFKIKNKLLVQRFPGLNLKIKTHKRTTLKC